MIAVCIHHLIWRLIAGLASAENASKRGEIFIFRAMHIRKKCAQFVDAADLCGCMRASGCLWISRAGCENMFQSEMNTKSRKSSWWRYTCINVMEHFWSHWNFQTNTNLKTKKTTKQTNKHEQQTKYCCILFFAVSKKYFPIVFTIIKFVKNFASSFDAYHRETKIVCTTRIARRVTKRSRLFFDDVPSRLLFLRTLHIFKRSDSDNDDNALPSRPSPFSTALR